MSGARSVLAILAGLVAVWFFANALTMVAVHLFLAGPAGPGAAAPGASYLAARIVAGLLAGELGGTICAAFARTKPVVHGAILGAVVVAAAAVAAATVPGTTAAYRWQGIVAAAAAGTGAFSGSLVWKALNAARGRPA